MIKESLVRDHFAARFKGRCEVRIDFGRIDVVMDGFVVEVEPFATWRHGVRQALAYAQETGERPAVAIYGNISATEAERIWDVCSGLVTVYLLDGRRWTRLTERADADHQWVAPPDDLRARKPPRRFPKDTRTVDEMMRAAAEAMNRVMAGLD